MNEKREIVGQWWLPSNVEDRWTGTLILENGETPRLNVTIPRGFSGVNTDQPPPPVLHGHDDHGKPVTLLFPGWAGSHGTMAMSQHRFSAGYAVLGIHLPHATDLRVHKLRFGVQYLNEWLGITGFQDQSQCLPVTLNITYRQLEPLTYVINPDLKITIGTNCSFTPNRNRQIISEDHHLQFESPTGFSLEESKRLIVAIRQLLHFAVLKPVYLLWLNGEQNGYGLTHEDRFYPHNIEIWCSINRDPIESGQPPDRWVFRFSDVQGRFSDLMANWLKFCDDYREALGCYSATVYHRFPDSMEFLCLTQALEAYHGVKHGRRKFKLRILELTNQFLPQLIGLVSNADSFADVVWHNRDYYTHHESEIKQQGRVVSGGDLYRLSEKLRLIFQMCVLTELGIPSERFVRLRRQLANEIIDYT